MLLFLAFAASLFVPARGRGMSDLALLTGAVCSAATLVKIHSTGTYVAWCLPFYLIGVLVDRDHTSTPG
jgi:hypothetical protein